MSQPLLAYNVWLALPAETRVKLIKMFSIPRSGEVIVRSGTIVNGNIAGEMTQDGHSAKDLYAITIEKMQEILKTDDVDFYKMFNHIVENIDWFSKPKEQNFDQTPRPEVDPKEKAKFHSLMSEPKKRGMPKGGWPKKHEETKN